MRFSAIVLGAAVLLSGVQVAQAQDTAVEGKVTLKLTLNVTTDTGSDDDDQKVMKFRLNTKDFISLLQDTTDDSITQLVMQRTTDDAAVTVSGDILNDAIVALDDTDTAVDISGEFAQTALDLNGGLATTLLEGSAVAQTETDDDGITKFALWTNEGSTWVLDGAADDFTLDMLSLNRSASKRKFLSGTDAGLWYLKRTAVVHGGADFDFDIGTDVDTGPGILTGTISVSPEKAQ